MVSIKARYFTRNLSTIGFSQVTTPPGLLHVRIHRNSLTSQCYVIGSTARYEDRQLSLAPGIWYRLSNTVVSESCDLYVKGSDVCVYVCVMARSTNNAAHAVHLRGKTSQNRGGHKP